MIYSKGQDDGGGWGGERSEGGRATAKLLPLKSLSTSESEARRKRRHYENNIVEIKEKVKRNGQFLRGGVNEWLSREVCSKCGRDDWRLFDLHHEDPKEKSFEIRGSLGNRKPESVVAEIDKCVVLCRACHMEAHGKKFWRSGCGV